MEERDPELRTSLNTLKDGDEEEDSENQGCEDGSAFSL